ncbi:hypothetical protein BGZ80_011405 [Entomortierella chlamydospora]|uniref:Kelch repeat protein n=1 Tax=Entomortierella chlamydospora TaxID=101097 RepID=A0A9P6MTX4_9FUNG|nr:hypothetical protein BGZ80_011405 [Entomortierella chlamydospora]
MAYVTLDESTLYIKGGYLADGSSTNQFYSLNLRQDWEAINPQWKALNLGLNSKILPSGPYHSLVVSKDKKSLIYWGMEQGVYIYDIANDLWLSQRPSPNTTTQWRGLRAVMNPESGLIYIPSGALNGSSMMVYDPVTGDSQTPPMPISLRGITNYSVTWSTTRNAFLLYGGEFYHADMTQRYTANTAFYQYSPDTQDWTVIIESGMILPTPGVNSCLVEGERTVTPSKLCHGYFAAGHSLLTIGHLLNNS